MGKSHQNLTEMVFVCFFYNDFRFQQQILVDFTVLCWQLVTGQCKEMETEKKLGGESMDSPR